MANEMDDLDFLLDEALKGYSGQEPPLGLEPRIIRRVHDTRRGWIWVPIAAALLAGVLMVEVVPPKVDAPLPPTREIGVAQPVLAGPGPAVTMPPAPRPRNPGGS